MQYRRSFVVVLPLIILVLMLSGPTASVAFQRNDQKEQPKTDTKTAALTGCVDEQEGRYVLIDARTMAPIANLEAEGFPTEGFAKHVGHTVTVRGISNSNGARPTFKVRSIETVSESCGPPQ